MIADRKAQEVLSLTRTAQMTFLDRHSFLDKKIKIDRFKKVQLEMPF
jgi:hypothetical protein